MDTILVIDDDLALLDLIADLLAGPERLILKFSSAREGLEVVKREPVDLILTDINMPDMNGIEFIKKTQEMHITAPIITITAYASTETAIQALRSGAYDYLSKPFAHEELLKTVENTLHARHLFHEVTYLRGKLEKHYQMDNIIGQCPQMQHIFEMIRRIGNSDCNVLVTGPSGTGKELIAQAIHNQSNRSQHPFVPINCSSIPETLLESELFGHTKGAFTDAICDKPGLIETAQSGTLFLDEIGDMPLPLQAKLLRVLQDHKIQRVGGTTRIALDIRIVAATNQILCDKIQNNTFRKDLYYRLNVVELKLPPLKERGNDIDLLACYFLKHYSELLKKNIKGFSKNARKAIENFPWPGNVRELENAIEHAATLCPSEEIDLSDLPDSLQQHMQPLNFSTGTLDERIFQFEDHCLRTTLEKCNNDFVAAMNKLGVSLPTLYRKAKKHKLSPKAIPINDIRGPRNKKKSTQRQRQLFESDGI